MITANSSRDRPDSSRKIQHTHTSRGHGMDKETRIWESLVAIIVIGLSVGAWVVSAGFPKGDNSLIGPALFPRVLGVILIVSSLIVLIGSWRPQTVLTQSAPDSSQTDSSQTDSSQNHDRFKLLRVACLLIAVAFTPLMLGQFGLLITAVVLTVGVCFLLGAKWSEALIAGGVMLVFVYLIFIQLLRVQA
jgi:putative tricarboxylic transport membrane protein